MEETLNTRLFRQPNLITPCLLVGSLERLSGGPWKAPEEVLCQRPASRLPHPNVPGHCSKRSQFWDPSTEDPQGLGPGDWRGLVPCRGTQGPHAGEDQAAHLLWRSDVSRGRSGRDGDHCRPRALRNCTETQQQTEERRGEVASGTWWWSLEVHETLGKLNLYCTLEMHHFHTVRVVLSPHKLS